MVYINGGTPSTSDSPYTGLPVSTVAEGFAAIKSALSSESWVLTSETATVLIMQGSTNNGHPVYVRFTAVTNSTITGFANRLIYVACSVDNNTYSTSANIVQLENGANNKLFLAADRDSLAICIIPSTGRSSGVHAGFLSRFNASDDKAIMVGYIGHYGNFSDTSISAETFSVDFAQVANLSSDGTVWATLGSGFSNVLAGNLAQPLTTSDAMARVMTGLGKTYTSSTNFNISRGTQYGALNAYLNVPVIQPYFYLEGRSTSSTYTTTNYPTRVDLWCKGYVKHCVTGFGLRGAGEQWNATDGKVYMSVGGSGYQGMRIA